MAAYQVAGLPVSVELPVPLIVELIPTTQTRQRPGTRRQLPGVYVQHETANPNPGADARMHSRYLHQGAPGADGRPQVLSYHFAVDDRAIYQMLPVDEIAWHAGDGNGPGNLSGISCELCVHAGIDHARARRNAEQLAAGIMGALNMGADRLRKHQDFSGKYCPARMLSEGYWATFARNVSTLLASPADPVYVSPIPPPQPLGRDHAIGTARFWHLDREVTAITDAPAVRFANPKASAVRAPFRPGERFRVAYAVQGEPVGGSRWWYVTPSGARVPQSACTPRVAFEGEQR